MKTIVASNNTSALSASAVNYMSLQANTVAAISTTESDVQVPMPIPGNYSDLWIDLDTQPGTGKSWKVTLRVNGADSTLFATVSDTATAAHLTGTNVAISIGDLVCVSWTPSGTPAVPTRQAYSCVFTGTNAGESFILMNRVVQQAANTTSYYAIQGDGAPNATETSAYTIMPTDGILDQMYVAVQTAPGGAQTDTFTFRKNASDQSMTATITGAATSASDLTHSVSVAQGDTTSVKIVTSATAAASRIRCSMRFVPTVDGESLALMPHNSTLAQNATVYRWFGHTATNATETLRQGVMPYAAILKRLFIQGNTVANGQTNVYTVRKNAADPASGLTVTITGNAGGTNLTQADNTNTVSVGPGDLVDLKGVSSATASSVIFGGGMVYYIPPPVGKSLLVSQAVNAASTY